MLHYMKKTDQFQIINTSELCNHTKHTDSQYETHMDNTKLAIDNLRDDMHIVQSRSSKVLQYMQHKLSKQDKVGSLNCASPNNSK